MESSVLDVYLFGHLAWLIHSAELKGVSRCVVVAGIVY